MVALTKKHPRVHPHPACGHLLPEGEGINGATFGQAGLMGRRSVLECGAPHRFGSRSKAAGTSALHEAGAIAVTHSPSGRGQGRGRTREIITTGFTLLSRRNLNMEGGE